MPSTISWLDFDARQNDRMNQILQLFEETGTLDELGIGAIRDSFADLLFPGTSTVQTRLRYFLITAWVYRKMEAEHVAPGQVARRVSLLERDLIDVIKASGETEGVFGRVSGRELKTLPSTIYWSGLVSWGLVRDMSRTEYHRKFDCFWWDGNDSRSAWDHVPEPPDGFPEDLDLGMTHEEADYIRSRVATSHRGTVLHRLMTAEEPPPDIRRIWQHPDLGSWDPYSRDLIRHGHYFAVLNEGANALYNLMLAELREHDEWVSLQRGWLIEWNDRLAQLALSEWDLDEMWAVLEPAGYNVDPLTRTFIRDWVTRVIETGGAVDDDAEARTIVREREELKKGARSKFQSASRRDQWNGGRRPTLLDFRWRQTVYRMLRDLHEGLTRGDDAGTE